MLQSHVTIIAKIL